MPVSERSPTSGLTESDRRRKLCELLYSFEKSAHEEGLGSEELLYDARADVFRFPGGRFALSREHADWAGLKKMGYLDAWGL